MVTGAVGVAEAVAATLSATIVVEAVTNRCFVRRSGEAEVAADTADPAVVEAVEVVAVAAGAVAARVTIAVISITSQRSVRTNRLAISIQPLV